MPYRRSIDDAGTILAADLLSVDPFGQPAIQVPKRLTRDYLAG